MLQASPISLQRLSFDRGTEALRLAAGAWAPEERASQLAAIVHLATSGRASDLVLIEARQKGKLVGAALGQCLPGKSAVVWLPQISQGELTATQATQQLLLEEMHVLLKAIGVHIAQVLLDEQNDDACAALRTAGYVQAGELAYMAAPAECFPERPPAEPLTFELHRPTQAERLEQVVAATYRGSLDCPLVDGLRDTADVLAGYRAVGVLRPELWLIVRANGGDVGCLLLADHPDEDQFEIVYAGLVPDARGHGWGRQMTAHALWMARQEGRSRVVLAVDAANWPAIAMYEACGFVAWDRRSVLVRSFRADATSAEQRT